MTKARDLSKLLGTNTNGVIPSGNLDVDFENIVDTGTEGTKVATGTTAQRGSTTGQIRFNSTTGLAEYYTGTAFKSIDSPPTISSINDTEVEKIVHRVEILNDDYVGEPVQLYGYCSLVKSSTKDTLEPIRGGGLKIKLEAGLDLTLEDLHSENERTFKVTYTRGEQLEFIGWLSPEGLYRDFVADKWVISLDATDGLGFLSDLSYVENNTKQLFVGKQTLIEVISNCLKRTNLQQDINIQDIRVFHSTQGNSGTNESTLEQVKVNSYRYIEDDNKTPISCLNVLKSILSLFSLSITGIGFTL